MTELVGRREGHNVLAFTQLSGHVQVVPNSPLAFPQFIHSGGKPGFSSYSSAFEDHSMQPGDLPGCWRHHRPEKRQLAGRGGRLRPGARLERPLYG